MKYIKGFNGLRAISIFLVLFTHLGFYEYLPDTLFIKERLFYLISGFAGVQIFFTLSGFLITSILLNEIKRTGKIKFQNFYAKRFLRLFPPLFFFFSAIFILMWNHQIVTTSIGYLMSFTYLYNFVPNKYYTGELGHTWSLAVEEQFYFLWPFLLYFLGTKKKQLLFIACFLCLCLSGDYLLNQITVHIHGNKYLLSQKFHISRWFIPAAGPVMIGSALSIWIKSDSKQWIKILKHDLIWIPAIILYVCPLLLPLAFKELFSILQSFGIAVFLTWIYFNQDNTITKILENRYFNYFGKISYGIYVYQGLFLRTGPGGTLYIQKFPQNIILTLLIAILSYEFIEKRFLMLKNRFR